MEDMELLQRLMQNQYHARDGQTWHQAFQVLRYLNKYIQYQDSNIAERTGRKKQFDKKIVALELARDVRNLDGSDRGQYAANRLLKNIDHFLKNLDISRDIRRPSSNQVLFYSHGFSKYSKNGSSTVVDIL
jgi:hypothetical protein